MNTEKLLTVEEVSKRLGIAKTVVRYHAQQGHVGRKVGRDWVFSEDELPRLIARLRGPRKDG